MFSGVKRKYDMLLDGTVVDNGPILSTSIETDFIHTKVAVIDQINEIKSNTSLRLVGAVTNNNNPVVVSKSDNPNLQLALAYDSVLGRGKIFAQEAGVSLKPVQLGSDDSNTTFIKGELELSKTANQICFRSNEIGNKACLNIVQPAGNWVYSLNDPGQNDSFVMSSATQTLSNKTLPTIQTNNIQSIGGSGMNITAGGGSIAVTNMPNGGFKVRSNADTSYGMTVSNSSDTKAIVLGTYFNGTSHCASIGAQTSNLSAWVPCYMQTDGGGTIPVIIGSANEATVLATGSKLYISGNTTMTGDMNSSVVLASNNIYLKRNGANGHLLTSTNLPSSLYTHNFQNMSGTLAQSNNICIYNKGGVTPFVSGNEFVLVDAGLFKLEVFCVVSVGTTLRVSLQDPVASILISVDMVGTGLESYGTSTSVLIVPSGLKYASINGVKIVGVGIAEIYGVRVFGSNV